jgi:hypothetical protein
MSAQDWGAADNFNASTGGRALADGRRVYSAIGLILWRQFATFDRWVNFRQHVYCMGEFANEFAPSHDVQIT